MSSAEKFETAKRIAESSRFIKRNFVRSKSFSFQYVRYRILRPLLKLNYKIFRWRKGETPWIAQAAIVILEKLLTRDMVGFEYGSGNSTLFIASKIKHLTSVEHNDHWFRIVTKKLSERALSNVDYHCIPPRLEALSDELENVLPNLSLIGDPSFRIRSEYRDYFAFVRSSPDNHFDFILIDGRARVECALNAIPKLKDGGILVLDNSDRRRYAPIFGLLRNWPSVTSTTGLFDTTMWFKPDRS